MRVVVVGNQKGGAGKTTISVGMAAAWADEGLRVLLVDADPQRSASQWVGSAPGFTVVAHDGGELESLLPALAADFDVAIVDPPPGTPEALRSALKVADLLVIPVQPSGLDISAAEVTIRMATDAGVRAVFALNRITPNTRFARSARDALAPYGVPVCTQALANRVSHSEASVAGVPVTVYQEGGTKAAAEMRALAAEIRGRDH